MINQELNSAFEASEPPVVVAENHAENADLFNPAAGLVTRAASIFSPSKRSGVVLLAAEHTTTHLVALPRASARQQTAMMQFAVEELIAGALDGVVVSKGPVQRKNAAAQLAFVTSKSTLAMHTNTPGLLPEFLMIPAPTTSASWNVWYEAHRVVVRASDGTGFAAPMALFDVVWQSAGRPAIYSLADALPPQYAAVDLSSDPPPPAPADVAFQFAGDQARETQGLMRTLYFAGSAIFAAMIVHLALLGAETYALGQQADAARNTAQTAIAETLPGITLTEDVSPILTRLAPQPVAQHSGNFLPLLTDVSRIISATPTGTDTPVTFRRLAWGSQNNQLVLLVQTGGLDDLQRVQQTLESNGFSVVTGAANAGEGGAEAEMRITRGAAQ